MIISASYKTDIPTFYGDWFMNRLDAGYCKMVNPYNRKPILISLKPDDVDGFIFWTKNIVPFYRNLEIIKNRGFPYIIQYTINAYPRTLEFSVVDATRSIDYFKKISNKFGNRTCVWRYDTIIFSSITPQEFHLNNFSSIAEKLSGYTDEVVISYVHFYKKTLRNMNWAENEFSFKWDDISTEDKKKFTSQLVEIAKRNNIQLSICAQRDFLVPDANDAHCVDASRLQEIAQRTFSSNIKGNRKECGCFQSRDIGDYDTCPHGCVYCYAVLNRELALKRYRDHDPKSEYLFPYKNMPDIKNKEDLQNKLFE